MVTAYGHLIQKNSSIEPFTAILDFNSFTLFFTLFYAHPHDGIQLERKHIPSESKNSLDFCPAQYEEGTKSVSRFFNHRNKFRPFYQEHRIRLFRFDTCFNMLPILLSASTKIKKKLHFNHPRRTSYGLICRQNTEPKNSEKKRSK